MQIILKHIFEAPIKGPYGSVIGWQETDGWIDGNVTNENGVVTILSDKDNVLFKGSESLYDMLFEKGYIQEDFDPWDSPTMSMIGLNNA